MKLLTTKYLFPLIILLLVWLPAVAIGAETADIIDSGLVRLNEGDYREAVVYFENVLETDPDNERALAYAARALRQLDQREQAFEYHDRLARREPEEFEYFIPREVYRFSAILAYQVGRYQRSLELFDRALKEVEDRAEIEQLRGWRQRASSARLRELGEEREAALEELIQSADQLLREEGAGEALQLLEENRDQFEEFKQFQDKVEQLEEIRGFKQWQQEVQKVDSQTSDEQLAELIEEGKNFYAREQFREESANYLSRLFFLRARISVQEDNYAPAREYLLAVFSLEEEPQPEAYQELIRVHYLMGNYEQLRQLRAELQRKHREFNLESSLQWRIWWSEYGIWMGTVLAAGAFLLLVFLVFLPRYGPRFFSPPASKLAGWLLEGGNKKVALWMYNCFCSPDYISGVEFENWIRLLKENGDRAHLLELLERGDSILRLSPGLRLEYGLLLAGENKIEKAVNQLKKAAGNWQELTREEKIRTGIRLGELQLKNNAPEEAIKWLSRARKQAPANEGINTRIIKLSARQGRWEEWRKNGQAWLKEIRSGYVQKTQRRGLTTESEKDKLQDPQSISQFLLETYDKFREVELEEENAEMLEFLYNCTEDLTDYQRQKELLKELVERDLPAEKISNYLSDLGDFYADREKLEEAVKYYRRYLEIEPDDFEILGKLGRLYVKIDRREDAVECFEKVFEFEKDNPGAARGLQQIARRYEKDYQYEPAARVYRQILDNSYFKKAEVQFRYGINLFRQGKMEDALSVFQKIEQGDEKFRARVLVFIARCLNEMGSPGVALSRLQEVDPDNQAFPLNLRLNLHYWYGRSLEAEGEIERALKHYREIMATDVAYRDVAERIEKLKINPE